ncbi:MAG: hypothetical protein II124_00875 [Clostridia bacterium]|nr:hypothetical protein [Clostridia bacterium]MBQ2517623.1 hypothetical protein [Clostridia bacterium]
MRSDVIHVTNGGRGFEEALSQAELVARYKGLPNKSALHLRLLAEEMLGMMNALTGEREADFWIDDEDGVFTLHLQAEAEMNAKLRKNLLAVSTSGVNAAAKGVTGKLRDLFERMLEPGDMSLGADVAAGLCCSGFDPEFGSYMFTVDDYWSLEKYRAAARDGRTPKENWDELEKSVIGRLADDVQVGIRGSKVEMAIIKKL